MDLPMQLSTALKVKATSSPSGDIPQSSQNAQTSQVEMDSTRANASTPSSTSLAQVVQREHEDLTGNVAAKVEEITTMLKEEHGKEIGRLRQLIDSQVDELDSITKENRRLKADLDMAQAKIDRLQAQRDRDDQIAKSAREKSLESELSTLQQRFEKTQSRLESLTEKMKSSQQRSEISSSKEIRQLQKQHDQEMQDLKQDYERQLDQLDQMSQMWQDRLHGMEREMRRREKFGNDNDDLERELAYLRYNFDKLMKLNHQQVDRLNELEGTQVTPPRSRQASI